jgi:hypothetical protein
MKTDDLIEVLSRGEPPINRRRRMMVWMLALAAGMCGTFVVMVTVLGMNPDLSMLFRNVWFWVRFAFIFSVGALAAWLFAFLGKPGRARHAPTAWIALPFAMVAALAAAMIGMAPSDERADMLLGVSWNVCSRNIALMAIPVFVASVWVARQFAPTRLRLTGAALGLFSGAVGAFAYSLHCPELSPPFLAVWYAIGMLIPAALGALLGKRLLAW